MATSGVHESWMQRAIELALRAQGQTDPNPIVGSVIIHDDQIIGEGYHERAGGAHAEVAAIEDARKSDAVFPQSTLYVTLEPCSTHGRTGPCVDAIAREKIQKVVIGTLDPNPAHQGRGIQILQRMGVEVESGVLNDRCEALNPEFNTRMIKASHGFPMIWSGGQTGVDQAALDWALEKNILHGGWCPQGRLAEDGTIPLQYHLRECSSGEYAVRTQWNVEDSDATLIISPDPELKGGSLLTLECAQKAMKPSFIHCPSRASGFLAEWLQAIRPAVLNVAGPRVSEWQNGPDVTRQVLDYLLNPNRSV
ncbi:MAG: bifunctional diaminohydroxyphosphoribosylaminopyrimidine deaminase/5-amino-6-(5-phosphoribosylamino)uracil reductase RibD [Verrucomicrobiota bacterium]